MVLFTLVGQRDLVGGGLKYTNVGAIGKHVLTSRYPREEYSGLGGGDDLFRFFAFIDILHAHYSGRLEGEKVFIGWKLSVELALFARI